MREDFTPPETPATPIKRKLVDQVELSVAKMNFVIRNGERHLR
jgi:hypothetical protein